jgi:hypothetical protein
MAVKVFKILKRPKEFGTETTVSSQASCSKTTTKEGRDGDEEKRN